MTECVLFDFILFVYIECVLFDFLLLSNLFLRFVLLGCLCPFAIEQNSLENGEQDCANGDDNRQNGQQRIDCVRSRRGKLPDQEHDEYNKRNDDQRICEPKPDAILLHSFGSVLSR